MPRFRWTPIAALALLVLLALACGGYGRPAEPPPPAAPEARTAETTAEAPAAASDCDAQPRNHTIEVGEQVSCKEPHVSKAAGNQITWRSTTGDSLEIVFKPKAGVNPFPSLSCPGTSPVCNSGAIDPAASGKFDYDIWRVTASGKVAIDPAVIIDP